MLEIHRVQTHIFPSSYDFSYNLSCKTTGPDICLSEFNTGDFQIDPSTGELTIKQELDREMQGSYSLTVIVSVYEQVTNN